MTSPNPPLKEVQEASKRKGSKNGSGGISGGCLGRCFGWVENAFAKAKSFLKNISIMNQNKTTLTCQRCRKWFAEADLIISPKGSFCEECYYE